MKKIQIIFITLSIVWMVTVFLFSNQPSDVSKNTSSFVTQKIVEIIHGDTMTSKELQLEIKKLDPIIRKFAHYTLYMMGGILICAVIFMYKMTLKKKIVIAQAIGIFYAVTDEIHQYFIPRKKWKYKGCYY